MNVQKLPRWLRHYELPWIGYIAALWRSMWPIYMLLAGVWVGIQSIAAIRALLGRD